MSVHCRVAHPHLLLKALTVLTIAKDAWATVVFTDTVVVLHVEGADQSITATATLPKALFSEYTATDAQFTIHLTSLRDALLLGGAAPLASVSMARIILAYPTGDARLLVELTDGETVLQSTLVTRPVKERLLDLRFDASTICNQIELIGDVTRDIIEDLVVAQCPHAMITIDPVNGVTLSGEGGPYGTVTVNLKRNSEVILSTPKTDNQVTAQTRVLRSHLALACGVRSGTGKMWRNIGNTTEAIIGGATTIGPATTGSQQMLGGFERLLFQINKGRQLSVVHMPRDHDVAVTVTLVVSPLCALDDE